MLRRLAREARLFVRQFLTGLVILFAAVWLADGVLDIRADWQGYVLAIGIGLVGCYWAATFISPWLRDFQTIWRKLWKRPATE